MRQGRVSSPGCECPVRPRGLEQGLGGGVRVHRGRGWEAGAFPARGQPVLGRCRLVMGAECSGKGRGLC